MNIASGLYHKNAMSIPAYLGFHPVLHHLGDGLHHFAIGRLLNQPDQNLTDKALPHLDRHDDNPILHQIKTDDQQLTRNWGRKKHGLEQNIVMCITITTLLALV